MRRNCRRCNSAFDTKANNQIYCSDLCRNKEKYNRSKTTFKHSCAYCKQNFFNCHKIRTYCSNKCSNDSRRIFIDIPTCLESASRKIDKNLGYVRVYAPMHPEANTRGYVYEHRLIAEQMLGRRLAPGEVVHHKNRIRWDNSEENLQVMTQEEHTHHHAEMRKMIIKQNKLNVKTVVEPPEDECIKQHKGELKKI